MVIISVSFRVVLTPNIHNNVTAFQQCWVSSAQNPEITQNNSQGCSQVHVIYMTLCKCTVESVNSGHPWASNHWQYMYMYMYVNAALGDVRSIEIEPRTKEVCNQLVQWPMML